MKTGTNQPEGEFGSDFGESKLLCYCKLFNRYVRLGVEKKFEQRKSEFKDGRTTAEIFDKSPKWLERMMDAGRIAWIKVGRSVRFHIPTSAALLRRRESWKSCEKCPDY